MEPFQIAFWEYSMQKLSFLEISLIRRDKHSPRLDQHDAEVSKSITRYLS
jgi:hypothetical protein